MVTVVNRRSATRGYFITSPLRTFPIDRDHSNMVKFAPFDGHIDRILDEIRQIMIRIPAPRSSRRHPNNPQNSDNGPPNNPDPYNPQNPGDELPYNGHNPDGAPPDNSEPYSGSIPESRGNSNERAGNQPNEGFASSSEYTEDLAPRQGDPNNPQVDDGFTGLDAQPSSGPQAASRTSRRRHRPNNNWRRVSFRFEKPCNSYTSSPLPGSGPSC